MKYWSNKTFYEDGRFDLREYGHAQAPIKGVAVQVHPFQGCADVCLRGAWKSWEEVRGSKLWARTRKDKREWVERIIDSEKSKYAFFALVDSGFDLCRPYDWAANPEGSRYESTFHNHENGVTAKCYPDNHVWFADLFVRNELRMSGVPLANVIEEARKLAGRR